MSKWKNATESPTFATNHLHTLKTREQKCPELRFNTSTAAQTSRWEAGEAISSPIPFAEQLFNPSKGRDRKRSRVMVWAGHRGRGGTTSMGPADRAEGFVTHTHGGPGAGQAREPDLSPKPSTEPREAPAPQGAMGQQQLLLFTLRHRATAKPVKKMTQTVKKSVTRSKAPLMKVRKYSFSKSQESVVSIWMEAGHW